MQDLYQYILEAVGNFGRWQTRRLVIIWILCVMTQIQDHSYKNMLRKPDKVQLQYMTQSFIKNLYLYL